MADPIARVPSRDRLKRVRGGRDGLYPYLELITPDIAHIIPPAIGEFCGDTLHSGFQSTANGTGSAAAAIDTGVVNGGIVLDPGTANDGRSDLSWGLHCQGQLNAVLYARMTLQDAITSVKVECGFTDVVSGTDAGAVNDLGTPTFNATDFVGWVLDTDDTASFQEVGVKAGTGATKGEPGLTVAAAGTYFGLVVALRDDNAKFYVLDANGGITYETSGHMTAAVTETVNLTPWLFVQNRSANKRRLQVDTLLCWQRRTTS